MNNLASNNYKRFRSLLDAIAADRAGSLASRNAMSSKICDLGPSVGDDEFQSISGVTVLGPSVGDDNGQDISVLGPSVGDDVNPSPSTVTMLGPSVGDDNRAPDISVLGPSVGDDLQESDLRLKQDVRRVGATVFGLPLYQFRYVGRPEIYEGVMAQDVLQVMPAAVSHAAGGYYRVNYRALGTSMRRVS